MTHITCPICEESVDLDRTPAPPFCSERCRMIDLGRWADERYGLQIERAEDPDNLDFGEPDESG